MDRPDLAAAFGIDQDRPDLAAAFGVDSTPEVAKPKRSYAAELANTLQKGNLYGSATTAMGASEWFGAADKGIRRKESGEWDLPTMAVNDGMIGAMESAVAGVAQKFGMRSGSLGSEASANLQNTFNEFQKTHGLSDEDVSTAWADLGNISRSWKPEEKFRTLSDGRILPNPANPDWLDPDKAESLIESTGTTDEAKADMRARLPEFQKLNSQARLEGYEAAASAIKSGDALTAPLLGAADLFLGHMQSPTEWAKENNRKDFGTPQFTRDYEKNVVEPAGTFEKATRGLKGLSTTGWNNVAMQALGTGGLLGSETLGNAAASASEANQAIRAGLPDTGLAGAVYEQGPSLIMQMLPTRLLGLASKSATVASLGTYGMAGLQSASMNYADMVAQGVPEDEAREKAVKTGISTVLITAAFGARQGGGVEALPIGKEAANASLRDLFDIARSKGITNLAKSPELRKVAREFLLNAGGEAAEEGIDQYMQAFLMADPDTNLADAWEQAKTAAKIGGVTGGAADLAMNALVSAPESARAAMGLPEKTNETAPETQTEAPTEPVASVDLGNAEPLPPASGGVETTGGAPNAVQTGVETSDLTNETALQNPQPTEQPVEQPVEPPVVSQSETPLTNETAIPNEKTEPSVAPVTPDSPANPSPDAGTKPDGEQPMEDQPYLSWSNGKGKIVGGSKQTPIQKAQWIQEQVNQVNDQLGIKRAEYVKDKGVAWANKNAQKIKSGQTQELLAKRAFLESSMPKFYDKNTGEPIGFDEALAQQESPPETRREGVSEPSTESLGLQYTETVSRMQGWSKSAKDFVDAYGSAGAQQVENAAAYLILRAKETGESVVSPAAVKRAKEIRKELRKQGFKVTDSTKPTIIEQNTQGQPGIQSETRRDGGETSVSPSATSETDTAELAELDDLTLRRGQAQNKVKGVNFSKKDEARFQELAAKHRDKIFEKLDPENDPIVGKDIYDNPIQQSKQGTHYTMEGGRPRTGPAFAEPTESSVQETTNRILANLGPPVNEGFAHTVDVGGTQVNLTPTENGEIEVSFVTPPDLRGQGRADAAIEKLKAEADREGAVIRVNVEPLGNESPMSREQLSDWYARRGFKMSEDGKTGVYRGQTYSIESLKSAFNLTDEQATVAKAIGDALGAKVDAVVKGGTPGRRALRQGGLTDAEYARHAELEARKDSLTPEELREAEMLVEKAAMRSMDRPIRAFHGTTSPEQITEFRFTRRPEPLQWGPEPTNGDEVWSGSYRIEDTDKGFEVRSMQPGHPAHKQFFQTYQEAINSIEEGRPDVTVTDRPAFFFATNPLYSQNFARHSGRGETAKDTGSSKIYEVFVGRRKIFDFRDNAAKEWLQKWINANKDELNKEVGYDEWSSNAIMENFRVGNWGVFEAVPKLTDDLKAEGYTGYTTIEGGSLTFLDQSEESQQQNRDKFFGRPGLDASLNYAIFDPSQIKSADPFTGVPLRERFNPENPSILYQYAGENARIPQFMRDSLETAKTMAAEGKTSEEIRAVTGWFPGPEGKMRWEIPDDGATLRPDFGKAKTVSELLDHLALFEAYPFIADVPIEFKGFTAGITKDGKTLVLPSMTANFGSDNSALLGGVLHEVQHLIQAVEGFARGGTTEDIYAAERDVIEQRKTALEATRDAARAAYDRQPTDANLAAWKASVDAVWDVMGEKPARRSREEELAYYRRIAGEYESRDVEARRTLTHEQRAATAPYSSENIDPKDLIILRQGAKGSFEITEDGKILLRGLQSPDFSTAVHEIAHAARRNISELLTPEEVKTVEDWAGAKNGNWNTQAEERWARGWERYFADGKAPLKKLQALFDKIAGWMMQVYQNIAGSDIDVEITDPVREIFDKLASRLNAGENVTEEPHPTEDRPVGEDNPNNAHSLKNEATNARLAQMGMPPIVKPTRFTNQQALDNAQAAFAENPDVGKNLVNAMIADPKKLPDVHDSAVLLIETANRQIAWQEARDARDAALVIGNETDIAEANLRLAEARDSNYQMKLLSNQQGTEQGRAFQFRKNFISDDYSLLAMENNYRDYVNGGKPLTEEQAAKVARLSEKMRQAEATLQAFTLAGELRAQAEEIRAKGGTENAEQANRLDDLADRAEAEADLVDLLSKDIERAQQKKPESFRRRVNSAIQKQAEEAMARIKARSAEPEPTDTTTLYSGLSPETAANIKDWAIVLAGKMSEKTMDIADAASWLVETFGNAIKPHIERVFGKARQIYHETEESLQGGNAPTVDQILESLDPKSELTKEDVWALARAEVIGGERGRDVLDAVHRNLKDIYPNLERDTVAELFTDYGIIRKARGPKELNRIRSIEREALKLRDLAQGQFPKRTGFQRGETDPESRNLKRDVNRGIRELEAKMREAGIEVPSDARRMKTATEARKRTMRNEIEEIQKALDTKTRRTKERGPVVQPDDEELALRQQLEVKRKEYDAVFGDETISDEERFKRMNESLDKQITEEEQSLRDGVAKRPNASKPVTPEIAEKRKRLSELRQSRRDLFDAQNPGTALEMAKDAVRTKIERLSQIIASNNVAVREKKPVAMDEELTALMETADALQDEVNERRKALPLTPEREKLNERRRVKQAEDTLAKIEAKLASGDLSVKTANPKPESPELRAVRGRIQELNRELAKRRREAPATPESVERRIQTYLKSIARRKSELDRKIASRDTTRTQREGPPKDPRITQAKHELNALHRTFNEMVMNDHLKNRTFLRRAFDRTVDVGLFLPRAALASMDISGFGRQGFRVLASNPKIAMRNFSKNFAWTEKSADEWQNALEEHPDYDLAVENGLSLPSWRPGHTLSDMEEHFQSRLAKSVPGVKHSERGYVTYLNGIRMAYFSQLVNALRMQPDGMTKNNIKGAAEFVNQMTGRGSLGKFNQYAPFLSTVFFAPRLVWSHVQTLAGIPYSAADAASGWRLGDILDRSRGREGTKAIRKLVAAERAKMTIGYSIIYSLMALGASMMGGDDEDKKAHIGTDPYSSDFGKLVTGERRVDLAGGILQPLVFLNRFLTGNFTDAGGKRVDLGNPKTPVSPDRMSVAGKFARSKLSPFAGLMVDTLSGKDYSGKPVYFDDKLASMYIPLPVSDLYESYRKLGMSGATASTLLNFSGFGTSVYGPETNAAYDSSIGKDLSRYTLIPAINTALLPTDYQVNPNWHELNPRKNKFIVEKDQ